VYFDSSVNPELAGSECLDSCPGRYIPGKEVPMPIECEDGWAP